MGYRVALMPPEVGVDLASARSVYARWPASGLAPTVATDAFVSALVRRWPSIGERPSRLGGSVVIDDEAPFQIDIDGGLVVLDVSWGAIATVLPEVHRLARSSSLPMFLPYEGAILPRRPAGVWSEDFEFVGRLLRPDEDVDLSAEWLARQVRETELIDDIVDVGHAEMNPHADQ
jgi:hypothetical protein